MAKNRKLLRAIERLDYTNADVYPALVCMWNMDLEAGSQHAFRVQIAGNKKALGLDKEETVNLLKPKVLPFEGQGFKKERAETSLLAIQQKAAERYLYMKLNKFIDETTNKPTLSQWIGKDDEALTEAILNNKDLLEERFAPKFKKYLTPEVLHQFRGYTAGAIQTMGNTILIKNLRSYTEEKVTRASLGVPPHPSAPRTGISSASKTTIESLKLDATEVLQGRLDLGDGKVAIITKDNQGTVELVIPREPVPGTTTGEQRAIEKYDVLADPHNTERLQSIALQMAFNYLLQYNPKRDGKIVIEPGTHKNMQGPLRAALVELMRVNPVFYQDRQGDPVKIQMPDRAFKEPKTKKEQIKLLTTHLSHHVDKNGNAESEGLKELLDKLKGVVDRHHQYNKIQDQKEKKGEIQALREKENSGFLPEGALLYHSPAKPGR